MRMYYLFKFHGLRRGDGDQPKAEEELCMDEQTWIFFIASTFLPFTPVSLLMLCVERPKLKQGLKREGVSCSTRG